MSSRSVRSFLLFSVCLAACADPEAPVAGRTDALRDLDSVEQQFLNLLNEYRVSNGLMRHASNTSRAVSWPAAMFSPTCVRGPHPGS